MFLMRSQYQLKYELRRVCLSVRMEQLGSQWKDFHPMWYSSAFPKFDNNIQLLLKSDQKSSYFTWSLLYVYNNTSLISAWNETYSRQTLNTNSKHMFYVQYFFSKYVPFIKECEKNITDRQATRANIIWHSCFIRCVIKDTHTRSHYVILIDFRLLKWLRERNLFYVIRFIFTPVSLSCNWTKTPLPVAHVNIWSISLHTTTCSGVSG
jgi:hypothetical protein